MNLVLLSPLMSDLETAGHYFWVYNALKKRSDDCGTKVVSIGPSSKTSDTFYPLLTKGNSLDGAYAAPDGKSVLKFYKVVQNEQIIQAPDTLLHFYDAGIADLMLIWKLYKKFPNFYFLLNLHWADKIANKIQARDIFSRIEIFLSRIVLDLMKNKVIITAESKSLSELASQVFSQNVLEYPCFSTYTRSKIKKKELDFILVANEVGKVAEILEEIGLACSHLNEVSVTLLTKPEVKESLKFGDYFLTNNLKVRVVDEPLIPQEYEKLHSLTRVLILPYSDPFYKWGSSGRLLDAKIFDCNVVLPADSEVARKSLRLGIGFTYESESRQSLNFALRSAMDTEITHSLESIDPDVDAALAWLRNQLDNKRRMDAKLKRKLNFHGFILVKSLEILIKRRYFITRVRSFLTWRLVNPIRRRVL